MAHRSLPRSSRFHSLFTAMAIALAGSIIALAPAPAAQAADDYIGAVSNGRGTLLGTASYNPPAGAIFVSDSAGSDSNEGTLTNPVQTVAKALALAPSGGTVVLRAGTYHESVTISKKVTIQNYPREIAWFDGSSKVTGWSKSGSTWTAPWGTFFSPSSYSGGVSTSSPYANYPAQVFIDGTALQQVGSAAAVTTGTFFADSTNKRLVIGSDPTNKTVRSSDLTRAIEVGATDITLRGFGVRRYATTSASRAAVLMDPSGGTFENLVISDNSSIGMALSGDNKTVKQVVVERNGMMGLGMNRSKNSSISKSIIRFNNFERFPTLPVASGIKVTWSGAVTINDNLVADNYVASGVWFDGFNSNVSIVNNTIRDNGEMQVNMELSKTAIIANNEMSGGRKTIDIRDSESIRVMNNRIGGYSLMGIFFAQDNRWTNRPSDAPSDFALLTRNNTVANNLFTCGTRFQLFANDENNTIPADKFNSTVTGNLFSGKQASPELNLMGWGLTGGKYDFLQTPADLANKNSSWKNLQTSNCVTNPEASVSASSLNSVAMTIPSDIATMIGVPSGTKAVGPVTASTTTPNQAPTAKITPSSSGLGVTVNGSGSSDSDGSIANYAWTFGDGGAASGTSASHTYTSGGTYPITLTVTDDDGAKATATASVTVAPAVAAETGSTTVTDGFSRTVASSWGQADTGQAWMLSGGNASFSVAGGRGLVGLTPGANREASSLSTSSKSSVTTVSIALSTLPKKGATGVTLVGRRVGSSYYGGRLWLNADGTVRLYALRDETPLLDSSLVTSSYKAGTVYNVKTEVTGTSPTTVRVKVWAAGANEPSAWTLSATDSTSSLQTAGTTAIKTYLSSSGTGTSTIALDDCRLVTTG